MRPNYTGQTNSMAVEAVEEYETCVVSNINEGGSMYYAYVLMKGLV